MKSKRFGKWAFIIGFLIAIIIGMFSGNLGSNAQGWIILLLVALGLIVGFLNIAEREITPFLVAAIALLVTGTAAINLAIIPQIGPYLQNIIKNITVFVTPAAIVVALKAIFSLARG